MPDTFPDWRRLLFHLLDELAIYEQDPLVAERNAVHLFAAIHWQMHGGTND